jgi:hypothetical protein
LTLVAWVLHEVSTWLHAINILNSPNNKV